VCGLGFIAFGPLMSKLLNFEVYYELKNEKITFTFVLEVARIQGTLVSIDRRNNTVLSNS